jgi:phosphopentomutase
MDGVDAIIKFLENNNRGLIFANLVDFDALYGHRNNPRGYADALEAFDRRIPEISSFQKPDDILIITADHGNDPTTPSTDHSRERVPILITGSRVKPNTNLGTRRSFTDVAATIAEILEVNDFTTLGNSFVDSFLLK